MAWKVWELQVARDLGGRRTGPQGRNLPDIRDVPGLAPECKEYKRIALYQKDLDQAQRNAYDVGEPWALFLKDKPGKGKIAQRLVVLDYYHFLELWHGRYEAAG